MRSYNKEEILKIAKRYGNPKRAYLLVDPLQAKHIPCEPSEALELMGTLGQKLKQNYPKARMVIGFAETATAIGAQVAAQLERCSYVQSTRENFVKGQQWVYFDEEHSHAVSQRLCKSALDRMLGDTDTVIFVDDEFSTGKTLINMIRQIKEHCPLAKDKRFVAASIINRVSDENMQLLAENGITCEYVLKIPNEDYKDITDRCEVSAAAEVPCEVGEFELTHLSYPRVCDPRTGVAMPVYEAECRLLGEGICADLKQALQGCSRVAVIGTEEYMYPALILGTALHGMFPDAQVRTHSTTRSPIGICTDAAYPITVGYRLHSFYEAERQTFLYNLDAYDAVLILTDSPDVQQQAVQDLCHAFAAHGCKRFFMIRGV